MFLFIYGKSADTIKPICRPPSCCADIASRGEVVEFMAILRHVGRSCGHGVVVVGGV